MLASKTSSFTRAAWFATGITAGVGAAAVATNAVHQHGEDASLSPTVGDASTNAFTVPFTDVLHTVGEVVLVMPVRVLGYCNISARPHG